jgi:4-amino-4-deoxy-L-arabinose transferase-like glycosyltransferase
MSSSQQDFWMEAAKLSCIVEWVIGNMTNLAKHTESDLDRTQSVQKLMRTFVLAFTGVASIYAAMVQLLPDEAAYWVWSRHLAASYFDHPPVVAYLIRAGTYMLGHNELGVRFGGVLLTAGTIIIMLGIARRILRSERAAMWVGLIWLSSPLLAGIGLIITPDTPLIFFSVCGLAFALRIAESDGPGQARDWLLFGLFTGLAFLSKYTAVLLPAAVVLALLTSATGRSNFRRPWIYLSGVLALVVFSPVVWWNYKHQWASFAFQLHHGTQSESGSEMAISHVGSFGQFWLDLGTYLGGQAAAWTPVLFLISVFVLVIYWRRYRTLGGADRVLLWTGTLPLVFFGVMYLKSHRGEANWPAFSYFPISLLVGRWLSETWDARRLGAVKAGVIVALAVNVVMHVLFVPKITQRVIAMPYRVPHIFREAVVWRERGKVLGQEAEKSGILMVANRHEDAAETAFYAAGQPEVWCVGIGSRPTAYDYFDDPPDFAKIPGVFWIGGHVEQFEQKYGFVEYSRNNLMFFAGRNQANLHAYILVRPSR